MDAQQHGIPSPAAEIPFASSALAGKFMTFKLGGEEYGLEILKVRGLERLLQITNVPNTESYVRGVINLRGTVIPVIDLQHKFGMPPIQEDAHTVIIVVEFVLEQRSITMGILVDEVLEVLELSQVNIVPAPDFGAGNEQLQFLLGIGKLESRVILLLDIDKVLTTAETIQLEIAGVHDN